MNREMVYVGTYTTDLGSTILSDSKGIYVLELDLETGGLTFHSANPKCESPTFLAVSKDHRNLYAINDKPFCSYVSAFMIDPESGGISHQNTLYSTGAGMSHVSVSSNKKSLITADYLSGNVNSWKLGEDGSLLELVSYHKHFGEGPRKKQDGPHPHSVDLSPDEKQVLVADLGNDRVYNYLFDSETAELTPNPAQPYFEVTPGEGPRHCCFHPNGKWVYVINELGNTVYFFTIDEKDKSLSFVQQLPSLPTNHNGFAFAAELLIPKNGLYLFAANRGNDCIARFCIDQQSGLLAYASEFYSAEGMEPRCICLSSDERYLLASNQGSDEVVVFSFDAKNGLIGEKICGLPVPKPTFVTTAHF